MEGGTAMTKKFAVKALEAAAGGAALTAAACIILPVMLKTGMKTIRKYAEQFYFDPDSGMIRRKDENVILLSEDDYQIKD